MENQSLIFDIKRFAIHDGPGIRITIFLKGCPLACEWCHNPEGQSKQVQKMYSESKCIGSKECIEVCEQDALILTREGIITDLDKCNLCGDCAEVCPTKAIEMSGNSKSIQDLMKIIKRETLLMDQSEGGVTFSGGEPLHHYKFLIEMLDACGEEGIHRCVDTTGFANASIFLEVAKRTDLFLYDLKMMNSEKHKKFTGVPNEKILQNLQLLATLGADYIIRIPLIKDINDDEENIRQTAAFIASLPGEKKPVQILPYHNIAVNKHIKLGHAGKAVVHKSPDTSSQEMALSIFDEHRISVEIGT